MRVRERFARLRYGRPDVQHNLPLASRSLFLPQRRFDDGPMGTLSSRLIFH